MVEDCDGAGNARLTQRNKFCRGDMLELLTNVAPPQTFPAGEMFDEDGAPLEVANHAMMTIRLRLPRYAAPLSILRKPR